jgi:hypothetical protein
MDLTKLSDSDLLALQAGDLTKVSDAGLAILNQEQSKSKTPPSAPVSALAGLGAGFGRTVLGGQELIGKGLKKVGAETIGELIERDAQMGRQKLAEELEQYKQANPFSAGGGQLVGEIGATLPVGGLLAKGLSAVPALSTKAAPLIEAIRTSGGGSGGLATRAAGGAIVGGTGSAMIDQESAGTGAAIGAAIPVVGAGLSKVFSSGAQQTPEVSAAINAARDVGYVIPPTQASPTLMNRILEGTAGKLTTAQNASARNQEVTNKLAAKSLGLPEETPITVEVLDGIRKTAGEAYDALTSLPVKKGSKADTLMNVPAVAKIDPAKMVYDLRVARADSNAYYKNYARTADPEALTKARNLKAEASRIEDALENYAKALGHNDLLPELRNARQLIAKTYTVESALNQTTGSVNAQKLASDLNKGKPLSAELKQVAEFSQRFPKAARTPEQMGSLPQFSPLDVTAGAGLSAILQDPMALATIGVRPVARSLALSPIIQNRLAKNPNDINQLLELLRTATPPAITGLYSE